MKHALLCLAYVAWATLSPAWGQQPASLRPYLAPSRLFALQVPQDWSVREENPQGNLRILAQSRDGTSFVEFLHQTRKGTLLESLGAFRGHLSRRLPGVVLEGVWQSPDRTRAVASWRGGSGGESRKGRIYVESNARSMAIQCYGALEKRLERERPVLLNVMASLAFIKGNAGPKGKPLDPPLVKRTAQDRSASISIPQDWQFVGGGGRMLAGDPRGSTGFIFTSFQGNPMVPRASVAQGIIGTRYLPPQQAMEAIFRGFGHRDFKVTSATPDRGTMRDYQARFGRSCDAQDMVATWISDKGAPCIGAFKVLDTPPSPMGIWNIMVSGVWAPQEDYPRYVPMLEKVGRSFAINDQYARHYIQAGLANLRRQQQQTAARMKELSEARTQNQADWEARQKRKDYMESRWDDYRRGQSYWVSDLEGGKVYRSDSTGLKDTTTGSY